MSIEKGDIVRVVTGEWVTRDGQGQLGRVVGFMLLQRSENASRYVIEFLDDGKIDTVPWWAVEEVDAATVLAELGRT